jgi:hypothetical protein
MLNVYVKNMQDYLKQVETGKITDKASADRLYAKPQPAGEGHGAVGGEGAIGQGPAGPGRSIKETYTHEVKLMDAAQLMSAATQGTPGV